jgi:hypothetical protein
MTSKGYVYDLARKAVQFGDLNVPIAEIPNITVQTIRVHLRQFRIETGVRVSLAEKPDGLHLSHKTAFWTISDYRQALQEVWLNKATKSIPLEHINIATLRVEAARYNRSVGATISIKKRRVDVKEFIVDVLPGVVASQPTEEKKTKVVGFLQTYPTFKQELKRAVAPLYRKEEALESVFFRFADYYLDIFKTNLGQISEDARGSGFRGMDFERMDGGAKIKLVTS